jgi:hypothetical protein
MERYCEKFAEINVFKKPLVRHHHSHSFIRRPFPISSHIDVYSPGSTKPLDRG